jgi:transposase
MIEDIEKRCPRCGHIFSFDFFICPNCGKKYNKKH